MAPNIKSLPATEIAAASGKPATEAVGTPRDPSPDEGRERLIRFLEREIWPHVPAAQRGQTTGAEEWDAALGFGPDGV